VGRSVGGGGRLAQPCGSSSPGTGIYLSRLQLSTFLCPDPGNAPVESGCPAPRPEGGLGAPPGRQPQRTGESCVLLRLGWLVASHPRSEVNGTRRRWLWSWAGRGRALAARVRWSEAELTDWLRRLQAMGLSSTDWPKPSKGVSAPERSDRRILRASVASISLGGYAFQPNRTRAIAARFYREVIADVPRLCQRRMPAWNRCGSPASTVICSK